MKLQCPYEQDLLDAISARRWPERAEPALRDHIDVCRTCPDVAEIAVAFLSERDTDTAAATLPSASAVWWRAQIRAREEAARMAARPLVLIQTVATVCAAATAVALAPFASAWVRTSITALGATDWWSVPADVTLSWLLGAAANTTLPLLAVAIWVVLAPVVVYLALDD